MFIFEVVGTIAFAVAGALIGIQKRLDVFGVLILAITTAVGGGVFRDMLVGNMPPMVFKNPSFLLLSIASALLVCLRYRSITKFTTAINVFDAIGLGAFAATGSDMALNYEGNTLLLMITLAVITGVGGGAIRDILIKEIPFVLCKEIYAVAVIVGAICFYVTNSFLPKPFPLYICFLVTTSLRLISMRYDLNLPTIAKEPNWQSKQ